MKKRELGSTGIAVSELAFGGVEIGMPYGIGVKSRADMLSAREAAALLHQALEEGINFYDSARMYGNSETLIGEAFRDRREKVVFCTKCRHFIPANGALPGYPALKEIMETSLRESLEALRTDYIDVFMLHQAGPAILGNEDVLRVFSDMKRSGRIRATGVSTYTPEETEKAIGQGAWDVVQLPFNLMDQRQAGLFSRASRAGMGIVVRSVLLRGLLSDRGRDLHPALKKVKTHIGRYGDLLGPGLPDLPSLAVKFALSFDEVASVLVGIDRPEYLEGSLAAADGRYLGGELLERAKALRYPDQDFIDLSVWDRNGWL